MSLARAPLRDYQQHCIHAIVRLIDQGVRRPAAIIATGGGKTVILSHLIPRLPSTEGTKVLVLAHRQEIVNQNVKLISNINPSLLVGIEMGKRKPLSDCDVVVASVSLISQDKRLAQYNPLDFKAIIVDECHHASAPTWKKVIDHFGSDIPVIGFTATFFRNDDKSLFKVFTKVAFEKPIKDLVKDGHLVDIKFHVIKVPIGLSQMTAKAAGGDFRTADLERLLNKDTINANVAAQYLNLRDKFQLKLTLVFCLSVAHCHQLCEALQKRGINAQYVTGTTREYDRKAMVDDFAAGNIDVLANCAVFTEGTDIPNIDSIFLARPSKLMGLLTQMIGRGLRKHGDKQWCHVIDLADTLGTGFQSMPMLFGHLSSEDFDGLTATEILGKPIPKSIHPAIEAVMELVGEEKFDQFVNEIMSNQVKSISLDGLEAYEKWVNFRLKTPIGISDAIRMNKHPWVRISGDSWALSQEGSQFYMLNLVGSSGDVSLTLHTLTPSRDLMSAGFRRLRYSEPLQEHIGPIMDVLELVSRQPRWSDHLKLLVSNEVADKFYERIKKQVLIKYPQADLEMLKSGMRNLTAGAIEQLKFAREVNVHSQCIWTMVSSYLGLSKVEGKEMRKYVRGRLRK